MQTCLPISVWHRVHEIQLVFTAGCVVTRPASRCRSSTHWLPCIPACAPPNIDFRPPRRVSRHRKPHESQTSQPANCNHHRPCRRHNGRHRALDRALWLPACRTSLRSTSPLTFSFSCQACSHHLLPAESSRRHHQQCQHPRRARPQQRRAGPPQRATCQHWLQVKTPTKIRRHARSAMEPCRGRKGRDRGRHTPARDAPVRQHRPQPRQV